MASAKQNRINRMIDVLENSSSWVSSSMLAGLLGASERSIRNYVAEVNETGTRHIESSKEGYRLATAAPAAASASASPCEGVNTLPANADSRRDFTISRLVNACDGLSVFDIADELFISESTFQSSVMPQVRALVRQFGLNVETHDYRMTLTGREADKRKLLGHIATHNSYGYFTSTKTLENMFPDFDVQATLSSLVAICQRSDLFINDYALSNLLVHLLVIIIRLTSNNELSEVDGPIDADGLVAQLGQREQIVRCAQRIAAYFEKEFGCAIPRADFQQILLLLALSVERCDFDELNREKLSSIIDRDFVDMVLGILDECGKRYNLPRFIDEPMRLQLVLHMFNAYQRAVYHVSYPNPLAAQIKSEYAPVYDMAVYIAHRFSTAMDIEVGENEIAFIAFHIGAYFEKFSAPDGAITCTVIIEEYHDFARRLVDDLKAEFGDDISVVAVRSCDSYLADPPESDVVVTTVDVPVCGGSTKILIGPILTKQNVRKIRDRLCAIQERRRRLYAQGLLGHLLRPELFIRNIDAVDATSCIDRMGELLAAQELVTPEFIANVHLRENVSSTAFTDCLAIPHAISVYPKRSFIAVVHNDAPIPWGRHDVRFVLLIGTAQEDMGLFRDVLDLIIEVFSSVETTMRLMQTDTFEEFRLRLRTISDKGSTRILDMLVGEQLPRIY